MAKESLMNWMTLLRRLPLFRYKKQIALSLIGIAIMGWSAHLTLRTSENYVTASPKLEQHFTGVMSEKMLVDFCYQLQGMRGITGVSYREYAPAKRTALITVYFNPRLTSARQIQIFMQHANILWMVPKAT